jgi:outer membrane protein TolC
VARTPALSTAAVLAISGLLAVAQPTSPGPLTLAQAVEAASKNYPSIRVSQEQMNAAAEGIRLARTAYLPRVDALAQINRATRNNVFGLLLPQNTIPSMSGPVIGTNNSGTVWGSAVGALATWEPFDFGLRRASVATAEATRTQSESSLKRNQFEIAAATIDAYLTLAAAQEIVRTAQAGVERGETVVRLTDALVNAQLRPGADSSRAKAELAGARTQLIQSRQAVDVAIATLSQFVGLPPDRIAISAPALLQPPPEQTPAQADFHANPITVEQDATVDQARSQLRTLERSYFPKFSMQAAVYARGTGAETDGSRLGGLNGLAPTVQDFAVGFSVTFPILDLPALRAREAAQTATIRAQVARSEQIVIELKTRWNVALAQLHGAREVAENTPVQVSAARDALQQASARYQAGLGAIDPVAEAQRLLTGAETDDALSHLAVWRALLGLAAAAGELQPFVSEAGK